jgi:hypothetical protein
MMIANRVHALVLPWVSPITAMQPPRVTLDLAVILTLTRKPVSNNDTGLDGNIVFTGPKYFQVAEIEVFEITA